MLDQRERSEKRRATGENGKGLSEIRERERKER